MGASSTLTIPSIKTFHTKPYPTISTSRPELSQAGRSVLITGGGSGIGFEIAKAFVKASAARIVIVGRRKDVLSDAVSKLSTEAKAVGSPTTFLAHSADVADSRAIANLWRDLKNGGIYIDVLVLNAAVAGDVRPILEMDIEEEWKIYEINVKSLLDFSQQFHRQGGDKKKYIVNVSTSGIHNFWTDGHHIPTYGPTKNSGTLLVQQIAKESDPDKMQVVSYHPGSIFTDAAKNTGVKETDWEWDDGQLPGSYAVWLASDEAQFLHGRFLDVHWDVDEVRGAEVIKRLEEDRHFLRVGVHGIQTLLPN